MPRFDPAALSGSDWVITYVAQSDLALYENQDDIFVVSGNPVAGDPTRRSECQRAFTRASCWRGIGDRRYGYDLIEPLQDVAAHCGFTDALEAFRAIGRYVAWANYGYTFGDLPSDWRQMVASALHWDLGEELDADYQEELDDDGEAYDDNGRYDLTEYGPMLGTPPHHHMDCECETCSPCECDQPHCSRCHPEGPREAGCECEVCHPERRFDDQGDDDDWAGLPDMPDPIPGRCRFGIEVEFNNGNRHDIMNLLQRNGLPVLDTGYTHNVVRYWKMTTDASVSGGELVSPIMSGDDASIEQVREAIRLVKQGGGVTGAGVGMHVHLDVTQFTSAQLKALAKNLRRTEKFFAGFVPAHRYSDTNWTRLMSAAEWDRLDSWLDDVDMRERARSRDNRISSCPIDRYRAFNFNALLTYGTVECRLLGHTMNTIKVRTWIRVLQAMIEASRQRRAISARGDVLEWLVEHGGLEVEHADRFRSVLISRDNERFLLAA